MVREYPSSEYGTDKVNTEMVNLESTHKNKCMSTHIVCIFVLLRSPPNSGFHIGVSFVCFVCFVGYSNSISVIFWW